MPSASVNVVMTGDEAKLRASQKRAERGQDNVTKATGRTSRGSRQAEAELRKFAQRMSDLNSTPLERSQKHMAKLREATRRGYLSQTRYSRAVAHTVQQLSRQAGISQRAAAAQLGLDRSMVRSSGSMQRVAARGSGLATSLVGGLVGAGGVLAAVGLVRQAYGQWLQEMEQIGQKHSDMSGNIVRELTETGDVARMPQIEAWINSLKGATREQRLAAFTGVSAGGPELALDRRLELAEQVVQQAPTGVDLAALGQATGELAKVATAKAADDIVDMSVHVRGQLGSRIKAIGTKPFSRAIQSLVDTGAATADEALALTTAAVVEASARPDVITTTAAKIGAQYELREAPALSAEDETFNRFAAAKEDERLRVLLDDTQTREQQLGEDTADRLQKMKGGIEAFELTDVFREQRAKGRGMEESLSRALLGQETAVGTKWEATIANISNAVTKTQKQRVAQLDEADRKFNQFVQAIPRERLRLLHEDKAIREQMLGKEQAGKFGLIKPEVVERRTEQVLIAQRQDLAAKQVEGLQETAAGREVVQEQKIAVKGEAKDIELGPGEARRRRLMDLVTTKLKAPEFVGQQTRRKDVERAMNWVGAYYKWAKFMTTGDVSGKQIAPAVEAIEKSGFETRTQRGLQIALRSGTLEPQEVQEFIGTEKHVRGDVVPLAGEAQSPALAPRGRTIGFEAADMGMRAIGGGNTQEPPAPIVVNARGDNRDVVDAVRHMEKALLTKLDEKPHTSTPGPRAGGSRVGESRRAQQLAELQATD